MSDQCCRVHESMDQCRYYGALRAVQGLRSKIGRWNRFLDAYLALLAESARFGHAFFAVREEWDEKYYLEGWNEKLFDNEHHDRRFDLGSGLVGWVFRNGQPVFAGEKEPAGAGSPLFARDVKTRAYNRVICLPVAVRGETRGVLGLACQEPGGYDEELKSFVAAAADYLSLFLENLYLRSKLGEALAKPPKEPSKKPQEKDPDEPV
jgi:transcriptional regulator with GAF, ATPase, and Fis domain